MALARCVSTVLTLMLRRCGNLFVDPPLGNLLDDFALAVREAARHGMRLAFQELVQERV